MSPIPARTPESASIDEALAHTANTLRDAIAILEADAAERGISLDDLEPPPPPPPEAIALDAAAFAVIDAMRTDDDVANATVIAAKIHRVFGTDDVSPELFEDDSVPNLMLIEHLLTGPPDGPEIARLRALLAPWFAQIPDEARAILAALVRANRAPSPP